MVESGFPHTSRPLHKRLISVFTVSLGLCVAVAAYGVMRPEQLAATITMVTSTGLATFDWAFLASVAFFIIFSFVLAFSRYGQVKLGGEDEQPEFSLASWVAMLFAAGMGAGLMFWGVAEPLSHFLSPPPGQQPMTAEAARWSLVVTNFHWGVHAWGIYAISGLILGYFAFRRGYPLLASSPIVATAPNWFGHSLGAVADLVAVLAVAFGIAGSLGMGVVQVQAGVADLGTLPWSSDTVRLAILLILVAFYAIPVLTRLDRGIAFLSNMNIWVAVAMLLYLLFWGPTGDLLSIFITSLGDYVTALPALSLRLYPHSGESAWTQGWTLTYMIWWIAWAPFVGIFIARISRGRTIREFVMVVVVVPTLFSVLWFAVFGGAGLHIERFGDGGLASIVLEDPSKALFSLFAHYPLTKTLAVTTIFLIFVFLASSAASGSFVLAMMTSHGTLEPSRTRKAFWALAIAALSAAILFSSDSVRALRAMAIGGALPFALIMLVHIVCVIRGLREEVRGSDSESALVEDRANETELSER
jgi:glycine betaine transporter